jgi:hypothetical protein
MKATITNTVTAVLILTGTLSAADSRLVNLVMPDATVVAGVNVAQAKNSPFGQWVLTLIAPQDQQFQQMAVLTGFDPRKDVSELLAATNGGPNAHTGLLMVTGAFNAGALTAAASMGGAKTENYNGVAILEDPKNAAFAFAFFDSTLAVAGDLADVKAAIDRQSGGAHLSQDVVNKINAISGSNDAWVLSNGPISGMMPPADQAPPQLKGLTLPAISQIQQASAAVKFGTDVTVTSTATFDTAQNASTTAGMLTMLLGMAQMQASKQPEVAQFAKNVTASASGSVLTVAFSMPQTQIQQFIQEHEKQVAPKVVPKKK